MLNDKQILIHPYNEILSNRKNRAIDSHNVYEFKMHFAMQKRLDAKATNCTIPPCV